MAAAPGPDPDATDRRVGGALLGLLLLLVVIAYLPILKFEFVQWDDPLHVTRNPLVVGDGKNLGLAEHLLTPMLGYPSPLTVATYRIEHALFGLSPGIYHATNLALHLTSCVLVFLLALRIGLRWLPACVAVVIFGLHPSSSEAVSWVSGRKDLLVAVLSLLAALSFLRHPFEVGKARTYPSVLLFLAAALTKPNALFLVPLLWLWQRLLLRRARFAAAVGVAPMLLISVVIFFVAFLGQRAARAVELGAGPLTVLREAWYALGFHTSLLLGLRTPAAKHLPHPWPLEFTPSIDLLPIALLIAAFVGLRLTPRHHRRAFSAGLVWALCAYLPSSNLIRLTRFVADVYLYLPLIGVGLCVGAVVERLHRPRSVRSLGALAAAVGLSAVILCVAARRASAPWRDSISLWAHAFEQYPHDARLCRNLGNAHVRDGDPEQGLALYRRCAGRFGRGLFEKNIAVALFLTGREKEARAVFVELWTKRGADPSLVKYLVQLGVDPKELDAAKE